MTAKQAEPGASRQAVETCALRADGRPLHVIQVMGTPDIAAAGPTYSVFRLCEALASLGADVDFMSAGRERTSSEGRLRTRVFKRDFAYVPLLEMLYFSRGLDAGLAREAPSAVMHVHGLWSMPTVYPARHVRRHMIPLVQSPRGMLSPTALSFSATRKKAFAAVLQQRALAAVSCFHATSESEVADIRAYGLKAPVAVLPNGIDMPGDSDASRSRDPVIRTVLYLGRMHPIKGIDRLLQAWARIEKSNPDWRLRLVGPSELGYRAQLEILAQQLGLKAVTFEDGLFGSAKLAAFGAADFLVLPTLNENFAMIVAEALACGLPVLATKGAPWPALEARGCGWWIDHGVDPMANALGMAMGLPRHTLDEMGLRGQAWMRTDYSWERIACDMLTVYRWCAGYGSKPACIVAN